MGRELQREDQRQRRDEETREALGELDAGQVVDGDEVLDWIDSWGSDKELEPPRPLDAIYADLARVTERIKARIEELSG